MDNKCKSENARLSILYFLKRYCGTICSQLSLDSLYFAHHRCNPDDCDAASFSPFGMRLESCVIGMTEERIICIAFSLFYYKM